MDDIVEQHDEPLIKPHVLPVLPTELWLTIFDHVVMYDTHIFDQSFQYRIERTHELQKLQYVCRSWRDMIQPVIYRHIALNGNGGPPKSHGYCGLAADHIAALAQVLDQMTDSGVLKASLVRSFWIQRDGREEGIETSLTALQESLPALLSRMTNLSELYCRVNLHGPQVASIAHSHGSRLTRLAIEDGGPHGVRINSLEVLPFLKYFTALTDLHLGIHGRMGELDSIDPPNLLKLHYFELLADEITDVLMGWLTRWTMPILSTFVCRKSLGSSKHMCKEISGLSAFMAKHGAGLRTLKIDDSCEDIRTVIFPHTPYLDVFDVFGAMDSLDNLPMSVTRIVVREFGENLGYQVRGLRCLLQTVQILPTEKKLHTIRMVSDVKDLGGAPFLWRERMQRADTRRVDTWREFKKCVEGLLELGVRILDEQNVALTDVLEEMGPAQESICAELLESANDILLGSDE